MLEDVRCNHVSVAASSSPTVQSSRPALSSAQGSLVLGGTVRARQQQAIRAATAATRAKASDTAAAWEAKTSSSSACRERNAQSGGRRYLSVSGRLNMTESPPMPGGEGVLRSHPA